MLSNDAKYKKLKIEETGFNDMAFLFGKDANELVYKPILKEFTKILPPQADNLREIPNPISFTVNNESRSDIFPNLRDKREDKRISFTVNNETHYILSNGLFPERENHREKREVNASEPVSFPQTPKPN